MRNNNYSGRMSCNIRIPSFIVFVILYCLLASAEACMTLGSNLWIEFGVALVCLLYFVSRKALKVTKATVFASIMLIASSMYYVHGGSIPGYISKFMLVSLAVVLINVKEDWRSELWETISKWYAVIVSLSIIFWLLHLLIPLPHITTVVDLNNFYVSSHNYFFFRETMMSEYNVNLVRRYQGIFLEPGHMGTITAFFLIVNRFDLKKKENWALFVGALLTLSASAYLLLAIGYIFHMITKGSVRKVFFALSLIAVLIVFFLSYKGGENAVNELIFEKLTREEGAVEGRVSMEVMLWFENMWRTGTDLWFGKGAFFGVEENSAGFLLFFVCCGIVGTGLLVFSYFSIYYSCKSKYGFFLFLIYIISFLQRTYPYWDAFSLPFILGLPYIISKNNNKRLNDKSIVG